MVFFFSVWGVGFGLFFLLEFWWGDRGVFLFCWLVGYFLEFLGGSFCWGVWLVSFVI